MAEPKGWRSRVQSALQVGIDPNARVLGTAPASAANVPSTMRARGTFWASGGRGFLVGRYVQSEFGTVSVASIDEVFRREDADKLFGRRAAELGTPGRRTLAGSLEA